MFSRTRLSLVACCAVAALAVGCSSSEQAADMSTAVSTTQAAASAVELQEGFVKAMAEDAKMTAIFGTVANNTDTDITIIGFEADVKAGDYEIHEVVDGKMQEKAGGLTVAAGDSAVLEPGHDHLMLLDVTEPIRAGDTVAVTLKLDDGSTIDVGELPVRTIASGDEEYSSHH